MRMHRAIIAPVLPNGKWAKSANWAKGYVQGLAVYLNQKQWLESPEPATAEAETSYYPELKEPPDEPAPKNTKPVVFTMGQFEADMKRLANK